MCVFELRETLCDHHATWFQSAVELQQLRGDAGGARDTLHPSNKRKQRFRLTSHLLLSNHSHFLSFPFLSFPFLSSSFLFLPFSFPSFLFYSFSFLPFFSFIFLCYSFLSFPGPFQSVSFCSIYVLSFPFLSTSFLSSPLLFFPFLSFPLRFFPLLSSSFLSFPFLSFLIHSPCSLRPENRPTFLLKESLIHREQLHQEWIDDQDPEHRAVLWLEMSSLSCYSALFRDFNLVENESRLLILETVSWQNKLHSSFI